MVPSNTFIKHAWMPVRDRKVLFLRSRKQKVFFYCAGGKPEPHESDHDALMREVWEETGVLLVRNTIRYLNTFIGPGHDMVDGRLLVMPVFDARCQGEPRVCGEIAELAWFTTADKHRTTVTGGEILDWFASQGKID